MHSPSDQDDLPLRFSVRRTCLEQVVEVIKSLALQRRDGTFLVHEVMLAMRRQGSKCSDGTVRVYVVVHLTRTDPKTQRPPLLTRVSVSRYRLIIGQSDER